MTKDEALDLALEALEAHADIGIKSDKAITAIKQALAAPVQPVAWCTKSDLENMAKGFSQDVPARSMRVPQLYPKEGAVLLYTTPPAAPVQLVQPVAWMHTSGHIQIFHPHWEQVAVDGYTREKGWTPLYTTPQRQWVGVTLTDREKLRDRYGWNYPALLVDAVSDILEEKNNG